MQDNVKRKNLRALRVSVREPYIPLCQKGGLRGIQDIGNKNLPQKTYTMSLKLKMSIIKEL